ncbi:ABC transporter permease [Streptomyces pinistramenti]|uniref:ABC transporter permease n=1 Tax=Streptomyces pinistramenti TaxID=2884812 RepID=UPI001D08AF88|nr:ABC transporter permease [Streptomyces pinistramenti]MCB5911030.1 ABC transporter permease [Streptomyces pinistramenti]
MTPRDESHPRRDERPPGEHEVHGLAFRDVVQAEERATATGEAPAPVAAGGARRISWQKWTFMPAFLIVALLITWLWFRGARLDSIAHQAVDNGKVGLAVRQHIQLTVVSTFFVLIIAIPLGIALTRAKLRRATPVAMAFANLGQAVPALGLLILLVIWLGIGAGSAVVGMVIYAVLPVLANTIAGLRGIDPTLTEAARGIGMSPMGVLRKVELPLAVPLILAGVRTALVLNVGTATLATFGGGGGLGDLISAGIVTQRMPVLILGSVLTVALALLVEWLASLAELLLRPHGLEATT